MTIETITTYKNEDGFEFVFHPIEDTLSIKKTKKGYEARYLIQDDTGDSPDDWGDESVFLVNYHSDFYVEKDSIITKDEVKAWYHDEKIEQEKRYYIFKLSCLVHSGVWLSLEHSFVCDPGGWDTSHVGLVLVSKKEAKSRKKAIELAEGLLKTWNSCLSGDVYCLVKETYDKEKKRLDYDTLGGVYEHANALEMLKTDI